MKKKLLNFKSVFVVGLLLFVLTGFSQTTKTTYDFTTAPVISGYVPNTWPWNTQADVTIGGVAYRMTCGGNGSFTNLTTGGESNSKCLQKDGSGGDQFTLQRTDGKPFQFYGIWVKHQSMNSYSQFYTLPPWYTLTASTFTFQDNTPMTPGTNWDNYTGSAQTISAGTNGVTTTMVQITFPAIMYFWIDNIIVGPTPLTATTSQSNVSCNGGSNGSATVTVDGGSTPYTYSWSPSGGAGATASGLTAGAYTCTITDAGNNSISKDFTITEPTPLSAISSKTDATYNGASDGTASVNVSGGTGLYSYSWSPSGGTEATATGLIAGSYTVTITDENSCTLNKVITVSEPAATIAVTNAASNISTTGATLNGTINADGVSTTVTFEYGTTTSYGTSVTADQSPVISAISTDVNYTLTGLEPNTTYHYHVVAVNNSGTVTGDDATFSTSTLTGTLYLTGKETLKVYPNPVRDRLYIETEGNKLPVVKLYNLQGVLMLSTIDKSVDMSVYASGAYVMEINGSRLIVMKK